MRAWATFGAVAVVLIAALGWRAVDMRRKQLVLEDAVKAKMSQIAAEADKAIDDPTPTSAAAPVAPSPKPSSGANVEAPPPAKLASAGAVYFSGELRPIAEADLAFKAGGRLARILVSQGDYVKEGQPLLLLDDREAQAQLKQAKAGVEAAKAQASMAADAQKRVESLGTSTALSDQQKLSVGDQSRLAHAGLMQAEAVYELAEMNVQNHMLRAPFSGRITRVPSGVGQMMAPGLPVANIVDSSRWKIVATTSLDEDAALGIVLATFFGFGIVLLTVMQKRPDAGQAGLDKFLFG